MSKYCPECKMLSYDEEVCDRCGYEFKPELTIDKVRKHVYNKPKTISRKKKTSTITINPTTATIMTALAIIAISLGYIAYDKYQEREFEKKMMKMIIGTDDPDKMIENIKKLNKRQKQIMIRINQESIKAFKKAEEQINNLNVH